MSDRGGPLPPRSPILRAARLPLRIRADRPLSAVCGCAAASGRIDISAGPETSNAGSAYTANHS
ncbi:hypothetical protein WJ86_21700 [Burkholderia multivorans]|nr:hypothetical protein WJ86_21700 [Burkholderia multivorans]